MLDFIFLLWRSLFALTRPYWNRRYNKALQDFGPMPAMVLVGSDPRKLFPIAFNVLAGGSYNKDWLMREIARLKPRVVQIMDNSDLAMEIQNTFPQITVIYRRWPDDNIPWKYPDAKAWLLQIASYVPDPRIVIYAGNEPAHDSRLAAWTVDAIKAADEIGRRLIVMNSGMGGPEIEQWTGPLLPILRALQDSNRWRVANGLLPHFLGLHEYFDFHNPWEEGWNPLKGQLWLIGRYKTLLQLCDQLGIDRPLIIITEWGSDSLTDKYHGWLAGEKISPLQYAKYLSEMLYQVYTDYEIFALLLFAWASDGSWGTFDVRNEEFLQWLYEVSVIWYKKQATTDTSSWEAGYYTVISSLNLNVRSGPGTGFERLGSIESLKPFATKRSPNYEDAGGYRWRQIVYNDQVGYIAEGILSPSAMSVLAQWSLERPEIPVEEPPVEEPPTVSEDVKRFLKDVITYADLNITDLEKLEVEMAMIQTDLLQMRDEWRMVMNNANNLLSTM